MDRGQGQSTKTIDRDNRQGQSTRNKRGNLSRADTGRNPIGRWVTLQFGSLTSIAFGSLASIAFGSLMRAAIQSVGRSLQLGSLTSIAFGSLVRAAIQSVGRSLFREVKIFAEGKRGPAQGAAIECSYCYGRGATTGCAGCQNSENIK